MTKNKFDITEENIVTWLASIGYIAPSNDLELARFERIHGSPTPGEYAHVIDHQRILDNVFGTPNSNSIISITSKTEKNLKMAARNLGHFPKHILNKMLQNQEKPKGENGNGQQEKTD